MSNIINMPNGNQNISKDEKNTLNKLIEEVPELSAFAMVLGMDDNVFNTISRHLIDELRNSITRPSDRMAIAASLAESGLNAENYKDYLQNINDAIDEGLHCNEAKKNFLKEAVALSFNVFSEENNNSAISIPIVIEQDGKMPTYAHETDAGLDIYAAEDIVIEPGETKLIKTGIKVAIPNGYELQVRPKSGISLKTKMRVGNAPGTIDSGYRDSIGIIIDNIEPPIKNIEQEPVWVDGKIHHLNIKSIEFGKSYSVNKGEKIAQLVLAKIEKANFFTVSDINEYEENRGGGFGSTGLK